MFRHFGFCILLASIFFGWFFTVFACPPNCECKMFHSKCIIYNCRSELDTNTNHLVIRGTLCPDHYQILAKYNMQKTLFGSACGFLTNCNDDQAARDYEDEDSSSEQETTESPPRSPSPADITSASGSSSLNEQSTEHEGQHVAIPSSVPVVILNEPSESESTTQAKIGVKLYNHGEGYFTVTHKSNAAATKQAAASVTSQNEMNLVSRDGSQSTASATGVPPQESTMEEEKSTWRKFCDYVGSVGVYVSGFLTASAIMAICKGFCHCCCKSVCGHEQDPVSYTFDGVEGKYLMDRILSSEQLRKDAMESHGWIVRKWKVFLGHVAWRIMQRGIKPKEFSGRWVAAASSAYAKRNPEQASTSSTNPGPPSVDDITNAERAPRRERPAARTHKGPVAQAILNRLQRSFRAASVPPPNTSAREAELREPLDVGKTFEQYKAQQILKNQAVVPPLGNCVVNEAYTLPVERGPDGRIRATPPKSIHERDSVVMVMDTEDEYNDDDDYDDDFDNSTWSSPNSPMSGEGEGIYESIASPVPSESGTAVAGSSKGGVSKSTSRKSKATFEMEMEPKKSANPRVYRSRRRAIYSNVPPSNPSSPEAEGAVGGLPAVTMAVTRSQSNRRGKKREGDDDDDGHKESTV